MRLTEASLKGQDAFKLPAPIVIHQLGFDLTTRTRMGDNASREGDGVRTPGELSRTAVK